MEQGTLFVKLESAREALPVQGRVVISQTVNGVRVLEIELVTDEDGLTQPVTLDAPDRSISLDPASTQQAWAAYDVEAYADGYSDILLEGVQVYSGVEAYAPISMLPIFSSQAVSPTAVTADTGSTSRKAQQDILHTTIPAPAIRGGSASGPAPLSTCATQPLVLQSVFIPQYITVHLGKPTANTGNVTVSFQSYIANVASSEVYPTWAGVPCPTTPGRAYTRIGRIPFCGGSTTSLFTAAQTFARVNGAVSPHNSFCISASASAIGR